MTNTKTSLNTRILLIEDQTGPLEGLTIAIREAVLGERLEARFTDTPEADMTERGVDVARSYSSAQAFVSRNNYDLVFLDHRLPYEDQGDLERKDFDAFCKTLDGRGYNLIPEIRRRNPKVTLIGTSSLSKEELGHAPQPDYRLDKCSEDVSADLRKIVEKINNTQNTKTCPYKCRFCVMKTQQNKEGEK